MRPPASGRLTVGCVPAAEVTSGISLKGFSDWRNLTTDESIQIAHLDDVSGVEASFFLNTGHANSLKHVDTIVSPTRDGVTSENHANDVTLENKEGASDTRTLVSLDKLATRSGRLLDSRLIFSPCAKGDTHRRPRAARGAGDRPEQDKPRTSQHRKLWHSDSELYAPVDESVLVESTSLDRIYNQMSCEQGIDSELATEEATLVKPLETITHTSKVCQIKTVPLLRPSNADTTDTVSDQPAVRPCPNIKHKSHTAVTKVCNSLTKSIRKKRKTLTNMARLQELFKSKDTKATNAAVSRTSLSSSEENANVSKTTSRQCLKFKEDNEVRLEAGNVGDATNDSSDAINAQYNHMVSGDRRTPSLGMRSRKPNTVTIDTLDMDLVCDLKRLLSTNTNNRKVQIKTNGSLRLYKPNLHSLHTERIGVCSPKRSGSRKIGHSPFRTNQLCIVSTV